MRIKAQVGVENLVLIHPKGVVVQDSKVSLWTLCLFTGAQSGWNMRGPSHTAGSIKVS